MTSVRRKLTDLILVLAALGLAIIWFVLPQPESEDPLAIADWSDLAENPPRSLTLRRGSSTVVLEIEPSETNAQRFTVTSPAWATADPVAVDRLLRNLTHLDVLRAVEGTNSSFGLAQPNTEIELVTARGNRHVAIGAPAPSPTGAHYARIRRGSQGRTLVVAAATTDALDVQPNSLLEHRVLGWIPSELRRIELVEQAGAIALEREDSGRWFVNLGTRTRARRKDVERLLLAITELSVKQLLDPAAAKRTQSSEPVHALNLWAHHAERDESLRLRLGGRCDGNDGDVTLSTEGSRSIAGCLDTQDLRRLSLDRTTIADNAAFWLHGDEVEVLDVSGHGARWTLRRDGSAFRLKTQEEKAVSLAAGNALFDALVLLHGTVLGSCEFSASSSDLVVSLRSYVVGDDRPSSDRIRLEPVAGDGTRPICRDDGVHLLLSSTDAPLLELDPARLRDPILVDTPIESIQEISLATPAGRQLLRVNDSRQLGLVSARSADADMASIESLREELSHLRVARWLAATETAKLAQGANATIEFLVSEPDPHLGATKPERHRLRIALDDTEQTVGWFDDIASPFFVDQALVDLIDGLLVDRSSLRLTDADRALSLSRGPDPIQLTRTGSEWTVQGSKPRTPTVDAALRTLEQLRAVAVLPRPKSEQPLIALLKQPQLQVAYAPDPAAMGRPRLRFAVTDRFRRRGKWVRAASIERRGSEQHGSNLGEYIWILRDDDLKTVFELLRVGR